MSNSRFLLIIWVVALLSGGIGFLTGSSRTAKQTPVVETVGKEPVSSPERVTASDNKVVKFISKSVSGKVKSVSGDELTLEEDGDSLTFRVSPEARITRVVIPSPTALPEEAGNDTPPEPETIKLGNIAVGEQVDATLTSQPDGSFVATEVTVLVESDGSK